MPTPTVLPDLLATLASEGGAFGDGITVTNAPNGNGGMQRTASYFFGFLITFVVLVFICVTCVLISRRRFIDRRRRRLDGSLQPWTENLEDGEIQIPTLIQKEYVKVDPVNQSSDWKELIPLAVKGVNGNEIQLHDDTLTVSHSTSGSYGQRSSVDQSLPVVTLTISTATTATTTATIHSIPNNESLTRSSSQNSGLVRITSEPYTHHQNNPNVIVSQQQMQMDESLNYRGDDTTSSTTRQTRPGFFQHFTPKLWHKFSIGRRGNGGQTEHVNDDIEQGHHHQDCSAYDEKGGHEEKDEEQGRFLQVAVIIEMPSPYSERGDGIHEYEFGIAQVPLHGQVDCIKI